MSMIISINGADFEPYQQVSLPPPLIKSIHKMDHASEVSEKTERSLAFEEVLKKSIPSAVSKYQETESQHKKNHKVVRAKDLMTSPVLTLTPFDTVEVARVLMAEKGIRHLPIVGNENKIVGIVSDRDIAIAKDNEILKVLMIKSILAAETQTLLVEIARVMLRHKLSSVPILNEERNVIGIITTTDLLDNILNQSNVELWT